MLRIETRRRYLLRGIAIALATPVVILIAGSLVTALTFDGKCGGFIPELSPVRPCTLTAYVTGWVPLLTLMVISEFWPLILALLAIPIAIGFVMDRRRARRSA
jgi:hypothetical protein